MQGVKIRNDLFSPSNVKCFAINGYASNSHQKSLMNGVRNVRHTLGCLERSINKSNEYEQRLMHCRRSHKHSHADNWWNGEQSDEKFFKCSNTTSTSNTKTSRSLDDCTDTWSSMSIICLQYQYEELAKRYKALIQAYDEQCYAVGMRNKRLEKWRQRVYSTRAHLTLAHTALLSVGEKYLALKHKRKEQKKWYEDQLLSMRQTLQEMMESTTQARMKFDAHLEKCMACESDSDVALLLNEIRKCNLLFLENMQLKALIEQLIPG
ncbi:hypothetical protein PYW07_013973 [Mythimna separata]|uniref:Uncharacterized protein n=1 Tax=Mythimna separata TaxID=271217 RepID=A0AAD7YFS2_MYTSE|nr:hypothetical protein PYW07_013973 [Mythimna separata]